MRTGDIAPPAVTPHDLPPGAPIATWPYRPVIALERLPAAAYVWDDDDVDVTWDDTTPERVWDAPFVGSGFTDASCDFHGVDIDPGEADELYLFPATSCTVTLDNRSGAYTPWSADGRLVYWAPGRRLHVWVLDPTADVNGYLTPTVGTVTTPDPGPLPGECCFVFKVLGPTANPADTQQIIGQWEMAPQLSWRLRRNGTSGQFFYNLSADGTAVAASIWQTPTVAIDTAAPQEFAFTLSTIGTTNVSRLWVRSGGTWTAAGPAMSNPKVVPFDSTSGVRIGYKGATLGWQGRIYVVELRTGLDPAAGTVVWRFDADDYPGTGTSYVDPRGRTWTLTTAAAITPKVIGRQWLFSGRVASWVSNADGTVTVTAYDGLAWLAQELGGEWTPGVAGQSVGARMSAIMSAAGYPDRVDVDAGTVTLTAPTLEADTSPLMAAQRVALSDGGLFYGDADGSLDYRNRLWRTGRADQPHIYSVSDNVCDAEVVVWDPEAAADDERLATDVRLVNTAGLAATAALTGSLWAGDVRYRLTHPDPDQWTVQAEGDTLAGYLLAQQSTPSMALSRFSLYVQDPQQPDAWTMAVATRRGDRVEVLHEFVDPAGTAAILDTFAVVLGVAHQITPEQWVADVALSRTVDYVTPEEWDVTAFRWDEPPTPGTNPANVWRH